MGLPYQGKTTLAKEYFKSLVNDTTRFNGVFYVSSDDCRTVFWRDVAKKDTPYPYDEASELVINKQFFAKIQGILLYHATSTSIVIIDATLTHKDVLGGLLTMILCDSEFIPAPEIYFNILGSQKGQEVWKPQSLEVACDDETINQLWNERVKEKKQHLLDSLVPEEVFQKKQKAFEEVLQEITTLTKDFLVDYGFKCSITYLPPHCTLKQANKLTNLF